MKKLLLTLLAALLLFSGCAAQKQESQPQQTAAEQTAELEPSAAPQWEELRFDTSLPLSYATQFSVRYAEGGYTDITIGSDQEFLLVAQDAAVPENVPSSITILRQPLSHIYLVASAAMDYFDRLDAVDRIALSGLKASDWYIESAKAAMEDGSMVYAGKYSAPDYETILEAGCDLAIENTMIYHTPEVIEQLQTVGVPVLVERSSYESDPLGRIEWLKLYAALVGKEAQATADFESCLASLSGILRENRLVFLHQQLWRGQRPKIRRLHRKGNPPRGRRIPFLRRKRGRKRAFDHDHSDGILLQRRCGCRRADLQQHHRR